MADARTALIAAVRGAVATLCVAPLCVAPLCVAPLRGQVTRYDVGQRLRAFESAFAAEDVVVRARCLPELQAAVRAFFGLDLGEAARRLARAARLAESAAPPSPAGEFAASLGVRWQRRLCDAARPALPFEVRALYRTERPEVDLVLELAIGERPPLAVSIETLPARGELPLTGVGPGDHQVTVTVRAGEDVVVRRTQILSLVDDLDARLARLRERADAVEPSDIERATLRATVRQCAALTRRRPPDVDRPGARWLADAEALAAAIAADRRVFGPQHTGDQRINIVTGDANIAARLFVPEGLDAARPRPLVVALHGAGGNEDLFFEGYGAGATLHAAARRGWFVVSPRVGARSNRWVGDLVAALGERYPIDRRRVFLLGHSMGGAAAVAAANRRPEDFAAVAILGGGGRTTGRDLDELRFFVAAGDVDFGRRAAERLAERLQAMSIPTTLKIYPSTEHLGIVQVASTEVFAFFDAAAGSSPGQRREDRE